MRGAMPLTAPMMFQAARMRAWPRRRLAHLRTIPEVAGKCSRIRPAARAARISRRVPRRAIAAQVATISTPVRTYFSLRTEDPAMSHSAPSACSSNSIACCYCQPLMKRYARRSRITRRRMLGSARKGGKGAYRLSIEPRARAVTKPAKTCRSLEAVSAKSALRRRIIST